MEQKYKQIGIKLMLKARAKYFIQMEIFSMVNIKCHKSMEKVFIFGVLIIQNIKANLRKIPFKEMLKFISLQINIILVE